MNVMMTIRRSYRALSRRLRPSQGFTLIELLVTIMLVGLVAAGILAVYQSSAKTFADQDNRIKSQDSARTAMDTISRYIREADLLRVQPDLGFGRDRVRAAAGTHDILEYRYRQQAEKVRFYVFGTSLIMQTAQPIMTTNPPTYPSTYAFNGTLVITGLTNGATPIFTYYAYSGSTDTLVQVTNPTTTADLASIVVVDIELQVDESPLLSKGSVSLHTRVEIRQRYPYGL